MELAPQKEGMIPQLHNLHIRRIGSRPGNPQSRPCQQRLVLAIEFVTVTVTFADLRYAVSLESQRVGIEHAGPRAQPHRSAHLFHARQLSQLVRSEEHTSELQSRGHLV